MPIGGHGLSICNAFKCQVLLLDEWSEGALCALCANRLW